MNSSIIATLALAALLTQPLASAREIERVRFEDTTTIHDQSLVLNGVGVNQIWGEKIFVAALYLPSKQSSQATVIADAGAKSVEIVYLRDVSASATGRFLSKHIRANDEKNELEENNPALLEFLRTLDAAGERVAGDRLSIDWHKDKGTQIRLNGKPRGEPIKSNILYSAFLGSLIGPKAKDRLREGLLGR